MKRGSFSGIAKTRIKNNRKTKRKNKLKDQPSGVPPGHKKKKNYRCKKRGRKDATKKKGAKATVLVS